jgi:LAO/AO transport system kinase
VENTEKALKSTLELAHPAQRVFRHHGQYMSAVADQPNDRQMWVPPIQKTVSTEGRGIPELAEAIARHAEHLRSSGDWAARERARLEVELEMLIQEALVARFSASIPPQQVQQTVERMVKRDLSPWEAARLLVNGASK